MMKASEFKAKCLAVMDEVGRTGQSVVRWGATLMTADERLLKWKHGLERANAEK
jgi:hypothetical protein